MIDSSLDEHYTRCGDEVPVEMTNAEGTTTDAVVVTLFDV